MIATADNSIGRSDSSRMPVVTQLASVGAKVLDSIFSESGVLFSRLDEMADEFNQSFRSPVGQVVIASTIFVGAGYVLYDIRKAWLYSAVFMAVPYWKQFDPLVVLDSLSNGKIAKTGNDAGTLLELFDDAPTCHKELPQ